MKIKKIKLLTDMAWPHDQDESGRKSGFLMEVMRYCPEGTIITFKNDDFIEDCYYDGEIGVSPFDSLEEIIQGITDKLFEEVE